MRRISKQNYLNYLNQRINLTNPQPQAGILYATPPIHIENGKFNTLVNIGKLTAEKRKARAKWHGTQAPSKKNVLNLKSA